MGHHRRVAVRALERIGVGGTRLVRDRRGTQRIHVAGERLGLASFGPGIMGHAKCRKVTVESVARSTLGGRMAKVLLEHAFHEEHWRLRTWHGVVADPDDAGLSLGHRLVKHRAYK